MRRKRLKLASEGRTSVAIAVCDMGNHDKLQSDAEQSVDWPHEFWYLRFFGTVAQKASVLRRHGVLQQRLAILESHDSEPKSMYIP